MENANDIKIIGMLGEVNNKVGDIGMVLKEMQERMNKNFCLLAESHVDTNDKLNRMYEDIRDIKFKVGVLESGVGLNSSRIEELSK